MQTCEEDSFDELLATKPIMEKTPAFIDYGCGKYRPIYIMRPAKSKTGETSMSKPLCVQQIPCDTYRNSCADSDNVKKKLITSRTSQRWSKPNLREKRAKKLKEDAIRGSREYKRDEDQDHNFYQQQCYRMNNTEPMAVPSPENGGQTFRSFGQSEKNSPECTPCVTDKFTDTYAPQLFQNSNSTNPVRESMRDCSDEPKQGEPSQLYNTAKGSDGYSSRALMPYECNYETPIMNECSNKQTIQQCKPQRMETCPKKPCNFRVGGQMPTQDRQLYRLPQYEKCDYTRQCNQRGENISQLYQQLTCKDTDSNDFHEPREQCQMYKQKCGKQEPLTMINNKSNNTQVSWKDSRSCDSQTWRREEIDSPIRRMSNSPPETRCQEPEKREKRCCKCSKIIDPKRSRVTEAIPCQKTMPCQQHPSPCQEQPVPCQQQTSPCQQQPPPCQKSSPCQQQHLSCQKSSPCQQQPLPWQKSSPCQQQSSICQNTSPCQQQPSPCQQQLSPCQKSSPCPQQTSPCQQQPSPCQKPLPCQQQPSPCQKPTPCQQQPLSCQKSSPCQQQQPSVCQKPSPCQQQPLPCQKSSPCQQQPLPCQKSSPCQQQPLPCQKSSPCQQQPLPCQKPSPCQQQPLPSQQEALPCQKPSPYQQQPLSCQKTSPCQQQPLPCQKPCQQPLPCKQALSFHPEPVPQITCQQDEKSTQQKKITYECDITCKQSCISTKGGPVTLKGCQLVCTTQKECPPKVNNFDCSENYSIAPDKRNNNNTRSVVAACPNTAQYPQRSAVVVGKQPCSAANACLQGPVVGKQAPCNVACNSFFQDPVVVSKQTTCKMANPFFQETAAAKKTPCHPDELLDCFGCPIEGNNWMQAEIEEDSEECQLSIEDPCKNTCELSPEDQCRNLCADQETRKKMFAAVGLTEVGSKVLKEGSEIFQVEEEEDESYVTVGCEHRPNVRIQTDPIKKKKCGCF